jgi:hypothetical protein
MHRRIVELALLIVCTSQIGRAQEFKLGDRTVQVHGFVSQGFVKTDENNWLTMNTSQGSGAMTDMGLNASSQLTDKFRVGAQVYDRNLGQLGEWHPSLDWAVADYRFTNWFGVRAGKVKTTMGLYNDAQDEDFLRVFALLPQSIYPTDLRDTTMAHTGVDLYGNLPLQRGLGDISYTAFVGHRSDSIYSGYAYRLVNFGEYISSLTGPQYGGDLRWNTALKGLLVGVSRLNQQLTLKGSVVDALNPASGLQPFTQTTTTDWTNQLYSEYRWRRLRADLEYRREYALSPYVPGTNTNSDTRGWYVAGSYRLQRRLEVGSYYSRYTLRYAIWGGAIPTMVVSDTSLPQNHVYDKVLAIRYDLNRYVYLKAEGHFINGYGLGPFPDGFYPQQNPQGFRANTDALVIKTGVHF